MQNMGINQLANMYMGNPQPLAQKVQQAQQQAKPGQIPPDLKEALALQQIQDMRQAAQNQQAMQAGGPQPTVVDQLKQMLAPQQQAAPQGMAPGAMLGMAPQAAPQMPQVRAASGGSIESLRSNLGSDYHGGGIVAFAGEDESLVEGDDQEKVAPADLSAEVKRQLAARLMAKPSDAGIAAESGARAAYAAPDTSGYDRAVAELQKRRTQMEAPKTGMPALMEYLQQVAQAPRGMGSLSAGAMGAQRVEDLQKQREGTQFDLTKQILEQEQKKLDVSRGYAKEMYGINKSAIDQAYKQQFEAAKELRLSDDAAKKLAQTAAENELNRQNRLKVVREQNANSLATANIPGQSERVTNRILALKAKGTPEALAQAEELATTFAKVTGSSAAGVGAERNQTAKLRLELVANQAVLKDIDATDEDKAEARAAIADIREKLKTSVTPIKLEQDGGAATQAGNKPVAAPTVLKFDASGKQIKG